MAVHIAIFAFLDFREFFGFSHGLIATIEDAVRMGVDAVKMLFPWNMSNAERVAMCERVGKVVAECEKWEIPLVLEPVLIGAPRTEEVIVAEE